MFWGRVFLSFLSLVIALFISELSLRYIAKQSLNIRYLATAGTERGPQIFGSLEELLATKSVHIQPGRLWLNFRSNNLGFYDTDWSDKKESLRIAAVGDSFCYGLVSYPANVQTLVENQLSKLCNQPTEVLNLGVPATGLWDYKSVIELSRARLAPDLYVLHIYLGNDGPDLLHESDDLPFMGRRNYGWFLPTFVRNTLRLYFSRAGEERQFSKLLTQTVQGEVVEAEPYFNQLGYQQNIENELGRFFVPAELTKRQRNQWRMTIDTLQLIYEGTKRGGERLAIVLYPSRLQIEPEASAAAIAGRDQEFDWRYPNKKFAKFAEQNGIPLLDLTPRFEEARGQQLYIARDTHWNIAGNALAARWEAEFLADLVGCSKDHL